MTIQKIISSKIWIAVLMLFLSACGGDPRFSEGTDNPQPPPTDEPPFVDLPEENAQTLPLGTAERMYIELCANCHGSEGSGGRYGPELHNCENCSDFESLRNVIETSMPIGAPAQCRSDCAERLAFYVLGNFENINGIDPNRNNRVPIADASASLGLSGYIPLRTSLNASASTDDHGIHIYQWDLGEGQIFYGAELTHIFTEAGSYTIDLRVYDEEGLNASTQLVVNALTAMGNTAPIAVGTPSVTRGERPLSVNFDASESVDDKGIVSYRWSFPDGSVAMGPDANFIFSTQGTFAVVLTVSDEEGLENSVVIQITVTENINSNPDEYFACSIESDTPEVSTLRRLSVSEYTNTIRDVLTHRLNASNSSNIIAGALTLIQQLADDHHESGFHSMDQRISALMVEVQFGVADYIAEQVTGNDVVFSDFQNEIAGCNGVDSWTMQSCRNAFITDLGELLLRRPITPTDIQHYSTAENYRELIAALLASPDFIFHTEFDGRSQQDNPDILNITNYELASRLSYLYWNTMPDESLFADARSGEILNRYTEVLARVFNDTRTRDNFGKFYNEWLVLEEITDNLSGSQSGYTQYLTHDYGSGNDLPANTNLNEYRSDAIAEILHLADYITWEVEGGQLAHLFTDTHSFAKTTHLARAYGVEVWDGNYTNLVSLPPEERSGLLTRAAMHLYPGVITRPILKGVKIRRRFLCDSLSPPADNSTPPEAVIEPHYTTREIIEAITEIDGTNCEGCHETLINPLGFPTENYDALGRFRNAELIFDSSLSEILTESSVFTDTRPNINVDNSGDSVADGIELNALLSEAGKTKACFSRNYYRYAFSRYENDQTDACSLKELFIALQNDGIAGMFRTLAEHPEFKQRRLQ